MLRQRVRVSVSVTESTCEMYMYIHVLVPANRLDDKWITLTVWQCAL